MLKNQYNRNKKTMSGMNWLEKNDRYLLTWIAQHSNKRKIKINENALAPLKLIKLYLQTLGLVIFRCKIHN